MKLTNQNPFYVIGVLSNVSAREIQKAKTRINAFAKVGKAITSEYDFSFLPIAERTPSSLDAAFSALEHNQDRLYAALFWFCNGNSFDETAIQYFINNNESKGAEILNRVVTGKEITEKNISSFNNYSTYLLSSRNKELITTAIALKEKVILSPYFPEFCKLFTDETFTPQANKVLDYFIQTMLNTLEESPLDKLAFFNACSIKTFEKVQMFSAEKYLHQVENKIEQCTKRREEDNESEYCLDYAKKLLSETEEPLANLAKILDEDNLKFCLLVDNLAEEVRLCCVNKLNHSDDNTPSYDVCIRLLSTVINRKYPLSPAIEQKLRDDLENIIHQKEIKVAEPYIESLTEIIQNVTKSSSYIPVKNAVEKARSVLNSLKPILNSEEYTKLCDVTMIAIQQKLIELVNASQERAMKSKNIALLYSDMVAAKGISEWLGFLDVSNEMKEIYQKNHRDLMGIYNTASQMKGRTTSSRSSVSNSNSGNEDDNFDAGFWGWIIFIFIILMFIFGR